ncbi:MAG: phage holin family protein, partial [Frankiaceae bacterium]|nr:phage holin family protein [Frankiaceae bacterium]
PGEATGPAATRDWPDAPRPRPGRGRRAGGRAARDGAESALTAAAGAARPGAEPPPPHGPAHAAAEPSIGELAKDVSRHVSTLVRGEIELAKAELRASVRSATAGIGMFAAAGALVLLALPFAFVALAEGLIALGLWRWLSYLAVFLLFLVVAGVLAWRGLRAVKRVKAPARTIATAKDTVDFLKHPTTSA